MTINGERVTAGKVEKIVKQLSYWTRHHAISSSDQVTTELRCKRQIKKEK